jgi:molecular chaperone HscA
MVTLRETVKASEDAAVVEAAVQALAKGTESFAARRMNEGIRRALAGKNLEAI